MALTSWLYALSSKATVLCKQPKSFYTKMVLILIGIFLLEVVLIRLNQTGPEEITLLSKLGSDEITDVAAFLTERGIPFTVGEEGSSILVQRDPQTILADYQLAQRANQIINNNTPATLQEAKEKTPDPRRVDAVRKELEKLLAEGSDHIVWARVGFPKEEQTQVDEGEGKTGAAVIIGTGGASLPSIDVERIQWVVANSFVGLKPSEVLVLNEAGHQLTKAVNN
jgi:flagellar biosynthesis/type III secretory pathway M-ring protein FliF/YscJ